MASAYKSALRNGDLSDSDIDINEDEVSSNTLSAQDSDDDEASGADEDLEDNSEDSDMNEDDIAANAQLLGAKVARLPTELRNRILMLTSRGVAHR